MVIPSYIPTIWIQFYFVSEIVEDGWRAELIVNVDKMKSEQNWLGLAEGQQIVIVS